MKNKFFTFLPLSLLVGLTSLPVIIASARDITGEQENRLTIEEQKKGLKFEPSDADEDDDFGKDDEDNDGDNEQEEIAPTPSIAPVITAAPTLTLTPTPISQITPTPTISEESISETEGLLKRLIAYLQNLLTGIKNPHLES